MKRLVLGILAHVDAGKTTLSEALLYETGQIRSLGRVDHQDAFLDTDAQEKQRGITIFSKQAMIRMPNLELTLLDTPGHVDFSAEMERALQVLDYAVLVISGTDGIQGHTRTLWRLLKHYNVPTFFFVNKMDLDGADKESVLKQLQKNLDGGILDFSSEMEQYDLLNVELNNICDENLADQLSMCNEEMMESYLESEQISLDMVQRAICNRQVFPCFFGAALKLEGVKELLAGLETFTLQPSYGKEFGARVYKIGRDPQGKRLTYLKVTSGSLKVKDLVTCSKRNSVGGSNRGELENTSLQLEDKFQTAQQNSKNDGITEKVDQIRIYSGDKFEAVNQVEAGQVCAVTGLSSTLPGTGLGVEESQEGQILTPVLNYRMILPTDVNPNDMLLKMKQLEEEDPELHIVWKEELKEIHAQLMGKVQIEVLTHLIRERFGVAVEFGEGNIVYKETIANPVEGVGHFEPLRHYAEVHLLMEPGEPGSGIQVSSAVSEDVLDLNWQRLIATHILEREHVGVLTGSGLTDVKFTIVNGRAHIKHTEGGDFRQATYRAIRQGLKSTDSILLEPMYSFILEVPADQVGRAMSDLKQRFGDFEAPEFTSNSYSNSGAEAYGNFTDGATSNASGSSVDSNLGCAILRGKAPVSTMQDYMTEVHAYTKGLGHLTLTLDGYDVCHNSGEIIESTHYDSEADTANPTGSVFCAHGAGFVVPWNQVPDYMHLEYRDIPEIGLFHGHYDEKLYEELINRLKEENGLDKEDTNFAQQLSRAYQDGFRYDTKNNAFSGASVGAPKKESQSAWELDQELQQIYAREFGMNKDDMLDYERKKWGKRNGSDSSKSSGQNASDYQLLTPKGKGESRGKYSGQGKHVTAADREYLESGQTAKARSVKYDKQGNPIYPKKSARPEHLIVDGYNIIFALEDYKKLAQINMDSAKSKLLDDLSNYKGYRNCKLTVVFDAYKKQEHPESIEDFHGITVVHTKTDMTADTYIEQMAHQLGDKEHITVATNDGLEQLTIMGQGALRMPARSLWEEMQKIHSSSLKDFHKKLVEAGTDKVTLGDFLK